MSRWRVLLLVLAGLGYAALSHWMMLAHAAEPWAVLVLLGPLWLTAVGLSASRFGKPGLFVSVLLGLGFFVLVWRGETGDASRLYVLQHVAINLLLCAWFGSTLRAGRLSLIGSFAQRVHRLTAAHIAYTWQVTRVWTLYFALMATASLAVFLVLPFAAWAWLSNVLSPVLVGALFIGEYLLRYRLHPEFERTTMAQAIKAFYSAPSPVAATATDPAAPR